MENSNKTIIENFGDFFEYLDIEKNLSKKSQEDYAKALKKFSGWLCANNLAGIHPHELSNEHIWKYRVYLSRETNENTGKPLKRSTQNYYLIALRNLLKYFTERDILSLPAEKIKLPKTKDDRSIKFLSVEQIERLLLSPSIQTIQGLRDRAILETLFSTGLRVAELVSLDREQIKIKNDTADFELGIIGKGSWPRTVYFSKRALNWLKKYLEKRNDKEKALFLNYRSRKDAPRRFTARSVERIIKKYALESGIPLFTTPHTMRHSMATDLLIQGVDLRTIQEFLGHRNIATTQIYTHVTNKRLRDIHRQFHSGRKLAP